MSASNFVNPTRHVQECADASSIQGKVPTTIIKDDLSSYYEQVTNKAIVILAAVHLLYILAAISLKALI